MPGDLPPELIRHVGAQLDPEDRLALGWACPISRAALAHRRRLDLADLLGRFVGTVGSYASVLDYHVALSRVIDVDRAVAEVLPQSGITVLTVWDRALLAPFQSKGLVYEGSNAAYIVLTPHDIARYGIAELLPPVTPPSAGRTGGC